MTSPDQKSPIDDGFVAQNPAERQEDQIRSIEITRWSLRDQYDDEEKSGEFRESYSQLGFEYFKEFIKSLREKYPDRQWPTDETLNLIDPEAEQTTTQSLTTYFASDGDTIVGAATGEGLLDWCEGHWFVVDPQYQSTGVAKKLIETIQAEYNTITLLASTFGQKSDIPLGELSERKPRRQQALVAFYQRFGFVVNNTPLMDEIRTRFPDAPVQMIWHRPTAHPSWGIES